MKIKEGDKIPNSEFYHLDENGAPKKISSSELFENNKTIVIGVPGAFTKVCSAKHLPGYINYNDTIINKGVDKIMCFAVNDPHVMKAWAEQNGVVEKIDMISDADASYTKKLGLQHFYPAMGERSLRFAIIIDDLVVKNLFVEKVGVFDVSRAENIIKFL